MPIYTTGGTVDTVRTWATEQTFDSGTFVSLPLSGGLAADDAVLPVFNSRAEGSDSTNRFMKIADASSISATGFTVNLLLPVAGLTANRNIALPDSTGELLTSTSTATMSNKTITGTGGIRCTTSTGTGVKFQNGTSTAQFAMFDMTNLTAQRNVTFPNLAGVLLLSESVVFDLDQIVSHEDEVVALSGT